MSNRSEDFIVGLDVGSHKTLCLVARPAAEPGIYSIEGYGIAESEGIRKGSVTNLEEAIVTVKSVVAEAKKTSQIDFQNVWVALGGQTLRSANCVGTTVVRGNEVTQADVEAADNNADEHARSKSDQLIKRELQCYRCGDAITRTPIGLTGQRLEAEYHAVYGSISNAENMRRCLVRSNLELAGYLPHPWAAAQAVLSDTDRYCGTVVFDLGAETTSIVVWHEGRLVFTDVRPYGAEYFTRDVATVFGIDLEQAEDMKVKMGHCFPDRVYEGETVQPSPVPGKKSRLYPRKMLATTLLKRAEEFFRLYRRELEKAGLMDKIGLCVITGGGANLKGIDAVASQILGVTVRVGRPLYAEGDVALIAQPEASVAMGCVVYGGDSREPGARAGYHTKSFSTLFERLGRVFTGDY